MTLLSTIGVDRWLHDGGERKCYFAGAVSALIIAELNTRMIVG